ncbi:tubulin binding cofactor A [Terfezia boudieri ATCC MYA-4762]|uniref:Tubulin-specific chaperone A n=1 Tax=Terfezia boudieri ATCC MYA-4762 TaxID=1051890 RepID=A0A3N4L9V8_9PEZI|nr:tubulin binding cofactor A [Terfezia boudieri ATCC MYA-4762]
MPPPSALDIRTSSVVRLIKEESSYHKELASAKKSLEKMLAGEEPDEYELRQQRKVVEETKAMIPEVRTRLQTALEALKFQLELQKSPESEPAQCKEKAQKAIDDAQKLLGEALE